MRRGALWLLAALLASCAGARAPKVGEAAPMARDPAAQSAYQKVLDRYSSHRQIYNGFDTRLFAAMTYQSAEFLDARVRREGSFQAQPLPVIEAGLEQEKAALAAYHELFVGVHLNNSRYDDFDRKNSIWRLALVGPEGEVTPVKVERVGRTNLNLRASYPYLDTFWVAYRVRFPKNFENGQPVLPPGSGSFRVRMASTLGHTEFEFPAP